MLHGKLFGQCLEDNMSLIRGCYCLDYFLLNWRPKKGIYRRDDTLGKNIADRLIVPLLPQERPGCAQSLKLVLVCVGKGKI